MVLSASGVRQQLKIYRKVFELGERWKRRAESACELKRFSPRLVFGN